MLSTFCPPTILNDHNRNPEKLPKSSADKVDRACEQKDQTLKKIRTLHFREFLAIFRLIFLCFVTKVLTKLSMRMSTKMPMKVDAFCFKRSTRGRSTPTGVLAANSQCSRSCTKVCLVSFSNVLFSHVLFPRLPILSAWGWLCGCEREGAIYEKSGSALSEKVPDLKMPTSQNPSCSS